MVYIPDCEAQMPTDCISVVLSLYNKDWKTAANGNHETSNGWLVQFVNGNVEFTVNTKSNGQQQVTKPVASLSGGWHYFFFGFNNGRLSISIDDGATTTKDIGNDSLVYTDVTNMTANCGQFEGLMNLLALYNRPLTATDKSDLIGSYLFADDLIGLYHFNETGFTIHDYSKTKNDGVVLGDLLVPTNTYYRSGEYYSEIIDIGKESNCNISVLFLSTATMYGGKAELQYSQSTDGNSWSEWATFKPGQRTFKYIKFKILLASYNSSLASPEVNNLIVNIDVPDKDIAISVNIAQGGQTVKYGYSFHQVPAVVPAAVGEGLHAELVTKSNTDCEIKIKNDKNEDVGGKADIHIRGF